MPETRPPWQADPEVKRREAELQEHLLRGPPDRGSAEQPITWLFEPESFAPMARLQGGEHQSIVTDYLGTPVGMYDGAGNTTWSARITTYGDLRDQQGDRYACPFRFPGQYEDPETGLYYNRFRYYDPEAGEYVSQDPIGLRGGSRLHAYVSNPTTWVDPGGLSGCRDVSTSRDTAYFWSGRTEGVGGERVAREIAETRGGVTLEKLIEERNIKMPDWDPNDPTAMKAWEDISSSYAEGASGDVHAVIGKNLRPRNVWETKELPALKKNPNVTRIRKIDPKTLEETTIFSR